ncbi:hypothetical protein HK100_008621 [Physocladia obscura]|uniref:WD40 repeat-like protein n=1 Tax=Physocladia obscura TaxID=109957 RepID=A0AAD5SN34_9FUNG|nr:hypothetical protein HK100_008621 [Physocladia obscura]
MQGSEASDYFQSDRDLLLAQQRQQKKEASQGGAFSVRARVSIATASSKVLCMHIVVSDKSLHTPSDLADTTATVAVVGESGHVARRINLHTGQSLAVYRGHKGPVTAIAIEYTSDANASPAFVFTASWDKTIKKFDYSTAAQLLTFSAHSDFVKSIVLITAPQSSNSLPVLLSASADASIRKWDTSNAKLLQTWKSHTRSVESLAVHQVAFDAPIHVYSASSDTSIRKWDFITGRLLSVFDAHLTSVYAVTVVTNEDGESELWSASADKTVKRWDLETETPNSSFDHPDFVKCVCVYASFVITGCRDASIRIFDMTSEKCINVLEGHFDQVSCLNVVGNRLYSASLDSSIQTWDLAEILKPRDFKLYPLSVSDMDIAQSDGRDDVPPPSTLHMLSEEEEQELAELLEDDA